MIFKVDVFCFKTLADDENKIIFGEIPKCSDNKGNISSIVVIFVLQVNDFYLISDILTVF